MTSPSTPPCARCGAPVEYSPSHRQLACPFCHELRQIVVHPPVPEAPVESIPESMAVRQSDSRTATCRNCGGTTDVAAHTAATRCAFCTHPLTIDPSTPARVPAQNLVPFTLDKTRAAEAFGSWIAGLWFRPSDLARSAQLQAMRGVYVPSWIYSAQAQSQWTAEAGYEYYVDEVVVVNGQKQTQRVRHIRWEWVSGHHQDYYRGLFVSASKGLSVEELNGIEPFDIASSMVHFEDDFLAGFEAESLALSARGAWVTAHQRIQQSEHAACSRMVPGNTQRNLQVQTQVGYAQAVSTLVPVYIAAYVYADTVYRLVVNGQTGKIVGKAPYSWVKITTAVAAVLFVVFVIWAASR